MMKIVFLGYGKYGAASLNGLLSDADLDIELIVTHPPGKDDPHGAEVLKMGWDHQIRTFQSKLLLEIRLNETIQALRPDVIVSTNWRTRIPRQVFDLARLGTLNIHDALLPKYGGLSAEQWVILNGETQTGVTVHLVSDLMDAGPIVHQIAFDIDGDDTAKSIAEKHLEIYPVIICEALGKLAQPDFAPESIDPSQYVRYHKLSAWDAQLRFDKTPGYLARQIRAWSGDFGGCWIDISGKRYGVRAIELPDINLAGEPGRVLTHGGDGVWIVTAPCQETGQSGVIIRELLDEAGESIDARKIIRKGKQFLQSVSPI